MTNEQLAILLRMWYQQFHRATMNVNNALESRSNTALERLELLGDIWAVLNELDESVTMLAPDYK